MFYFSSLNYLILHKCLWSKVIYDLDTLGFCKLFFRISYTCKLVLLNREWSMMSPLFPSRAHLAMSEDILLTQLGGCYWNLMGRGQNATKYSTMHSTAPQ